MDLGHVLVIIDADITHKSQVFLLQNLADLDHF